MAIIVASAPKGTEARCPANRWPTACPRPWVANPADDGDDGEGMIVRSRLVFTGAALLYDSRDGR